MFSFFPRVPKEYIHTRYIQAEQYPYISVWTHTYLSVAQGKREKVKKRWIQNSTKEVNTIILSLLLAHILLAWHITLSSKLRACLKIYAFHVVGQITF